MTTYQLYWIDGGVSLCAARDEDHLMEKLAYAYGDLYGEEGWIDRLVRYETIDLSGRVRLVPARRRAGAR